MLLQCLLSSRVHLIMEQDLLECSSELFYFLAGGCIQQIKMLFLQHLAIPGFPQSDHTVSKLSGNADSLWNTVKQAFRPEVILKTRPPICLNYRSSNRPQILATSYHNSSTSKFETKTFNSPIVQGKILFPLVFHNIFCIISLSTSFMRWSRAVTVWTP